MSKRKIIDPATQEVIIELSLAGRPEIEVAIADARKAFDEGPWPKFPLAQRKEYLLKIAKGILDNASGLARLETLNTGKPIKESTFMDIPSSARVFEHFANNLEAYLKEEALNLENAKSTLTRQPQGVVALIVPWNYPLLIASWKLSAALAAGNTVILKPSSLTPLTALELGKIIDAAGLPEGVVNVINSEGSLAGEILCSGKRVDMVSFTGSNEVGKQIMQNASGNIKKLLMELGGKSAGVVLKDANLELAVNGSLCSAFLNQGQMCTAMSRILIEDDIYDKFVEDFVAKAKRIKLGPGKDHETQMGPLISEAQRKKVSAFVEEAKKQGAKVLCGGKAPVDESLKKGFFFEPTVLVDVTPGMRIFRQEVFGPVVTLHKFSSVDEALSLANDSDFGLAAALWSADEAKAGEMAKKINSGTVWINTYGMFYPEAPYGGFKQSGFGKELGKEGFLEYTRLKNIFMDQTKGALPLVNYWYGF